MFLCQKIFLPSVHNHLTQYIHCFLLRYWIWKYNLGFSCCHVFVLSCFIQMTVVTKLKIQHRKWTRYDVRWLWTLGKKYFLAKKHGNYHGGSHDFLMVHVYDDISDDIFLAWMLNFFPCLLCLTDASWFFPGQLHGKAGWRRWLLIIQ